MALNQMSTLTFRGQRIKSGESQMLFLKLPGDPLHGIQEKLMILRVCRLRGAEVLSLLALMGAAGSPSTQGSSNPPPRDPPCSPP